MSSMTREEAQMLRDMAHEKLREATARHRELVTKLSGAHIKEDDLIRLANELSSVRATIETSATAVGRLSEIAAR